MLYLEVKLHQANYDCIYQLKCHKIGTNEMFKEKEARKNIPLSYLELVMDKLRYNPQVRIENAFRIKNAKN